MVRRRHGWVTAADIVFPKLRRKGLVEALLASGVRLTPVQEQTLRLAVARGEVRRRDIARVCGISPELARELSVASSDRAFSDASAAPAARATFCATRAGDGETRPHRANGVSCYDH